MGQLQHFLAPIFIGNAVATALWGMLCVQLWTYLTTYYNDSVRLSALVYLVYLLDTAHQVVLTVTLYDSTIAHFGDDAYLVGFPVVLGALLVILVHVIALIVHCFYLLRIWRLSQQNMALTGLVFVLILAETGSILYDFVIAIKPTSLAGTVNSTHTTTLVVNALQFSTDITISAIMCFILTRTKSEYKHTRSLIRRIMIFTLSTNVATSLCALMSLILCAALPETIYFLPFFLVKGRFYANSLMATLNIRPYFARVAAHTGTTIELPERAQGGTWQHSGTPNAKKSFGLGSLEIHVDMEHESSSTV